MVHSAVFFTALLATVTFVTAAPGVLGGKHGGVIEAVTGRVGAGDLKTGDIASHVVSVGDINVDHVVDDLDLEDIL